MQIGFLTNCLRERSLPEIIEWAGANGFTALELAAWPRDADKVDPSLDVVNFDQQKADGLNALAKQNNITFTCLTFCGNTIAHKPEERQSNVRHLRRVIDAAQMLGVSNISTFIGRDPTKTQAQNFDDMAAVFGPLVEYAAARNVRIAIENCPMPGWQFEGLPGNLAYSPHIWDEMFTRIPHPNFGLNFDPSHLLWLDVDPYAAVKKYASRVLHTHAKDTQIFDDKRDYYSIEDSGWGTWWQYRLPGKGVMDWKRWAETLRSIDYDGVLSIEHEDPEYEHTEALVKEGLLIGKKNLTEAIH
jgi:sugar phosphate isomerase/epimerase